MAAEISQAHDSKLESAGAALQRCNELIAEEARAEYKKEATLFRTRKLLTNIDQVAMVLEGIAELHPIAKGAVKQFRCLIGLELDRQNNNEQIVAICHTMANMLYTIHLITDDIESDTSTGLKHQLENEMDQATVVMCDFGVFADMYYVKMSARVVRYLRTTQFKRELGGYAEKFNGHRRTITDLLTARIHSKAVKGGQELAVVLRNTDRILEKMVTRHTDAERAAAKVVAEYGGEEQTMRNPDAVRKVAAILELEPGAHKEPVTDTTFHLLTGDFSELLKENRGRFELKLGRMTSEIRNSINRGAELIVHKLDQGPYNMIEDPNIRVLWKSSQWRMSAKARSFMHEFYMHYIDLFYKARLEGEPVPDQWTLKVLDVTYHPALSEAVDEDATGYLSVHELNNFTRRKPPHFSIPVWFAFWAVGCRYLNATIAASMEKSLADIERKCEQLKDDIIGADFANGVEEYLNTCRMLRYVLSYCQLVDVDEHRILADLDDDASGHLQEWAHKYHEYVSKGFEKRLQALHHYIDDRTLLYVVIGTSDEHDRIEQAFFPLAEVIIRHQHTAIKEFFHSNDRKPKRIDQFTQRLSEMDATIYTLLAEYHKRMKGLVRSWRAQKLDVELELECYNGGIMYGWYTAYQDPKTFIRRKFDGSTPGTHMSQRANRTISAVLNKVTTLSEHAERNSARVGELSTSVNKLSAQVDGIDGRISDISSTLEKRSAWSFLPDKRDILLAGMAAWLVYMYRRS